MMRIMDNIFTDSFEKAKKFSDELGDFEINNLKLFRNRKRYIIRISGELVTDEPIDNPIQYFKISVFFVTIDIILQDYKINLCKFYFYYERYWSIILK